MKILKHLYFSTGIMGNIFSWGFCSLLPQLAPQLAQASLVDRFVFFPNKQVFSQCTHASSIGAETIDVEVGTDDGGNGGRRSGRSKERVRYYLLKGSQAKANFIYFHGNAGSACDRLPLAQSLQELNKKMNVIMVEYPGYSNDPRSPSEERILANSLEAYDHIKMMTGQQLQTVLYGESLGTAVTTYLAANRNVESLILHAPFPSLVEVGKHHYPFLPVARLLKSTFKAYQWASGVKSSVLILHGKKDKIIPLKFGKKQAQNFTQAQVQFQLIDEADHNDLTRFPAYWEQLRRFLTF